MPIPDEKARAWTRPEDYWPPRRSRTRQQRGASGGPRLGERDDRPDHQPRPMLGTVPYVLLMLSLGVLAVAIMVVAWPGNRPPVAQAPVPTAEVGTAPRGWMDGR